MKPRYPIYIPSKGRAKNFLTAKMFERDGVDFKVVVEPSQVEAYAPWADRLLVLPEDSKGLVYARNWIKDHAVASGAARHWQFDDDIRRFRRLYKGYRLNMESAPALCALEDFVDRYENVALASFNSTFFVPASQGRLHMSFLPPFHLNSRCYTCFLMDNSLPNRWRFRYNEDTDMTLQVLADGHCTVLFNAFLIETPETMTAGGGQAQVYSGDGRLKMARDLERVWPGVVTTHRRFGRPQHRVKDHWCKFDTKLRLKPGVDLKELAQQQNEYGLKLCAVKEVQSEGLRRLIDEQHQE